MLGDIDLGHLTSEEKELILAVLDRNSMLRSAEELRIKSLKEELRALRMKGVPKSDRSVVESCSRCGEEFGWFFNKGVACVQCLQMVCPKCRQNTLFRKVLCIFCSKQNELEAKCGNWFYGKMRQTTTNNSSSQVVNVADVTRTSLLRKQPTATSRRDSSVGTTLDEVRRALVKSNASDAGGVSCPSCDEADRKFGSATECSAFPQDEDKKLLKDLLDLRGFGLATPRPVPSSSSSSAVKVRQVYGSKYKDSDSSDDDGDSSDGSVGEVDSPHVSSRSESVYRKSDSIRSSLQTNSSSIVSDDGSANRMSLNDSFHDSSTHFTMCGHFEEPLGQNSRNFNESDKSEAQTKSAETTCEKEHEVEDGADTAATIVSTSSDSEVPDGSCRTSIDVTELQKCYKTATDSKTGDERNNNTRSSPLSSASSQRDRVNADHNDHHHHHHQYHCNESESASSVGSPISASMPSIAVIATNITNSKSNVAVNGAGGGGAGGGGGASDEENEDIGEMFALYGSRRANSQTNLNKLSSSYSGSKESINSCYSEAGEENYGKLPVTGEILFGLSYNYTLNILEITIRRCKDLAAVDAKRNRSDPYVKTYLLPDRTKTGKRKTRIKKHTLNPVFDEILKYQVMKCELETRTLSVMVWHSDRFGRNDFLGEVNVSLDYYSFDNPTPLWHRLRDRSLSPLAMLTYKGDLNVCLKFVSAEHISGRRRSPNYKGELQVIVKEARNLTAVRSNGYSDPFCKGYLLPDRSHKLKQKTAVVKKNCNPTWNQTFLFENVSWDELTQRSLELTVWDYDRLTSNDFLGGVRLNIGTGRSSNAEVDWMDAKGEEVTIWQTMLDRPNCWIEGTLLLRVNMNQSI